MSTLTTRARAYLADAGQAVQRAPVEVALVVFSAIAFSVAIEIGGDAMLTWLEVVIPALLVLAFAWTGTLLHALGTWSNRTRWAVTIAGALSVALYAQFVIDLTRAAEGWRAAALIAVAVLWLCAVPAFGAEGPTARMRQTDGRILLRTLAVVLYGAALYLGLALALAAIDTLFELGLEGEIYGHVFGWIFIVLVPWVIFGGLDDYVRPAAGPEPVASAVHRLTRWLVPPLLALYLLILYAYMVRIPVTGEVPKNLVSPMVLAAGALTALALLLFDPQPRSTAFDRALRLGPVLFLPLAPLGAWALAIRIEQYGWTEFRALRLILLAAFTALAGAGAVQLWRRRAFALPVLPVALAAALLLAVLGPWSVLALSRNSQQTRLENALARVAEIPLDTLPPINSGPIRVAIGGGLGPEAPPGPVRTVPAELYDQVLTDARYLHTHFGREALPPSLARHAAASDTWVDYAAAIGLQRAVGSSERDRFVHRRLDPETAVALAGGTGYRIEFARDRAPRREAASRVTADSLRLVLHLGGPVLFADLAPLLTAVGTRADLQRVNAPVPVTDAAGTARGELLVLELGASYEEGRQVLQQLSGLLLLRDSIAP